jgi:hypothetical protein
MNKKGEIKIEIGSARPEPTAAATKAFEEWLATRPDNIVAFCRMHPVLLPGVELQLPELVPMHPVAKLCYLIGFTEEPDGIGLMVTPIDPLVDYHGAIAAKERLCAGHFRQP